MFFIIFKQKYPRRQMAGLLFCMLTLFPQPGWPQNSDAKNQSPVSVEVHVTPVKATLGDIITYSVRVRHDRDIKPHAPNFVPPEGLEFIEQGTRKLKPKKDQLEQEFWFRLRADRVGSYSLPQIPLPFEAARTGNETIPGQVLAPQAELEVQSILRLHGEPTDIRDIKPLENIARNWGPWIWTFLISLLAIASIVFLLQRRNNRPKTTPGLVAENLSPQEVALKALEALKNRELLEKGQVREYYFELSEIFRRYLGAQYRFNAIDWTTEEIRDHLISSSPVDSPYRGKILAILENSDRVKFAKIPTPKGGPLIEEIILFIQATARMEGNPPVSEPPTVES